MDGIGLLTNLQSLTLEDNRLDSDIPPAEEVRHILYAKLGPASGLKHVDIYGTVLHLVDGQWVEVTSSVA